MPKCVIFSALLTLGLILPAASALAVPPTQLAMAHHDTTMKNKELVLGFYKDILNDKKLDKLKDYFTEDVVDHDPMMGDLVGLAKVRESMTDFLKGFPDLKVEVLRSAAEGDLVFVHIRMTGTNSGAMMGMPATGKKIDVNAIDIIRVKDGKCAEHWMETNSIAMMQQLGLMQGH